jgi:hypothetical protein
VRIVRFDGRSYRQVNARKVASANRLWAVFETLPRSTAASTKRLLRGRRP